MSKVITCWLLMLILVSTGAVSQANVDFSECLVCREFHRSLENFSSTHKLSIIKLDNGIVFLQSVKDSSRAKLFISVCQTAEKALKSVIFTEDNALTNQLCGFCKGLRNLVRSGAQISWGQTESGGIIVVTSTDPQVLSMMVGLDSLFINRTKQFQSDVFLEVDEEPTIVKQVKPHYPPIAYSNKIESYVVVAILLNTDGRVLDTRVVKSVFDIFNESAIECVKKWRFKPALKDGKPVKFWYHVPVIFKLD